MSSICWRIAWASKPTCGNAHSSSSSSTSSSSCFILSLFFLKVGISFPGHFFKVAARTAFFLKTNNELWATLVGKHFKKNYSLWNNDNRKKKPLLCMENSFVKVPNILKSISWRFLSVHPNKCRRWGGRASRTFFDINQLLESKLITDCFQSACLKLACTSFRTQNN